MNKRGDRLIKAAKEALAIVRGELDSDKHVRRAPADISVKAIRERKGLTQSEFATKYGFTLARVRDWEQGRSKPDAAMKSYLIGIDTGKSVPNEQAVLKKKGMRRTGITARAIEDWGSGRDAQSSFPFLVRRLVNRTASVTAIAFPGGDAVSTPGWDGAVSAAASTPWVPKGHSYWELGTNKSPRAKADADYYKRTNERAQADRLRETFIFVTPRKWLGKRAWLDEKLRAAEWKDVRVYDALDLEEWIEQSPATAIWFSEQLQISGTGLMSLDEAWRSWSRQTDPSLTVATMIAGRERAREEIIKATESNRETISVRADSVDEAVAFITACFYREHEKALASETLVVTSEQGWRFVDANPDLDFVIVARPELARERSVHKNVKVFIPFAIAEKGAFYRGRAASAVEDQAIVVDRLQTREFESALVDIGIDAADAQRLARLTSRSWTVFRRLRAKTDALAKPDWLEHDASKVLSTVCLVGAWSSERLGDLAVVERVAGRPYEQVERDLRVLATLDDAPVLSIGSIWRAKSPLELLHLVGQRITNDELDRYFKTAEAVLAKPDPALELANKDRWAAALYKKVREESGIVIEAICDSMVKLAVLGPNVDNLAVCGIATRVSALVRNLISGADGERWLSLSRILSELAEASPAEFLSAIERSLQSEQPAVLRLFEETGPSDTFGGRCWHADLLWALEILAWRSQDTARVVRILVGLSKISIRGNWINSPKNTLLSIFRSWMPQTAASVDQRIILLDRVIEQDSQIGWDLLVELGLRNHDSASPNARPKWREDDARAGHGASNQEIWKMLSVVGEKLLTMSAGNASRIARLIKGIRQFDDAWRKRIVTLASEFSGSDKADSDRAIIRLSLSRYLHWHRHYDERDREIVEREIADIDKLYRQLEPVDVVARFSWLFSDTWIELPDGPVNDFSERERIIGDRRIEAIRMVLANGGLDHVERLITAVKHPYLVGMALSKLINQPHDIALWIQKYQKSLDEKGPYAQAISGFLMQAPNQVRELVISEMMAEARRVLWTLEELVRFLKICPCDPITWGFLNEDDNLRDAYWKVVTPHLTSSSDELNEIARQLLRVKRPRSAFIASEAFLEKIESRILYNMLDDMRIIDEPETRLPEHWYIGRAFDLVETSRIIDDSKLAALEFAYVGLLEHSERGLRLLQRHVASDPTLFSELITMAYKPKAEALDDLSENQRNAAASAWRVLSQCGRIPGQEEDGTIDVGKLQHWVSEVRRLCAEKDRAEVGDLQIGHILAHAPIGEDGIWPCETVREVLNADDAGDIRQGFLTGAINSRGVTTRAYDEGGEQERTLTRKYARFSEELHEYPLLQASVRAISEYYDEYARREDVDAKVRLEGH